MNKLEVTMCKLIFFCKINKSLENKKVKKKYLTKMLESRFLTKYVFVAVFTWKTIL
jgi:hypothetical protein